VSTVTIMRSRKHGRGNRRRGHQGWQTPFRWLSTNPEKALAAIPAAAHGAVGEPITGDIVILALPYGAVDDRAQPVMPDASTARSSVDLTNPVDFANV